ncbi:hypothetical protein [Streptomyces sp. NPDC005732]|uniref:hypothetical protein n=1 Tax=Streptomyces sp. NPDC005732 TaxID=3157057 RepID=UPI0033CCFD5D
MTILPEPPATAGQATPTAADRENIRRLFAALDEAVADQPTAVRVDDPSIPSFEDGAKIGDTPPVSQPDSRIVPAWAAGVAVASIGVGAGATGLGCAAWLACKGLSMVSVPGLERFALIVIAPFAGAAMVLTAAGVAISKARTAITVVNNNGPVYQDQREIRSKATGLVVKNNNQQ